MIRRGGDGDEPVSVGIVVGGHGPDLERLDQELAAVASRYAVDPLRLGFAGFSDGVSRTSVFGDSSLRLNRSIATTVPTFSASVLGSEPGSSMINVARSKWSS